MMFRPKFHYTPANNWMNDPNGLVYDENAGIYHMYYQYCKTLAESHERKYWGHAVSRDLVRWKEQETAIAPDSLGSIWSGSAVIDKDNTSGLFSERTPSGSRIVAFFTYAFGDTTYGWQKQGMAYSEDGGKTFIKYSGNPLLRGYDNRDPKVIWYAKDGVWLMVIAGMRVRIFSSHNLRDWRFESEPVLAGGIPLESECPDLFPIALDGNEDNIKWFFCGAGRCYVIGDIRKKNGKYVFVPETGVVSPMHGSDDMYAAQSFFNGPVSGRRTGIYWMVDKTSDRIEGKPYDGAQSISLEYSLVSAGKDMRINVYPVKEINSLRKGIIFEKENIAVREGDMLFGSDITGDLLDIEAVITIKDSREFGICFSTGGDREIRVSYDCVNKRMILDKEKSGNIVAGINTYPLDPDRNGKIGLRILKDTSVMDVFGNNGEANILSYTYPDKPEARLSFRVKGEVYIDRIKVYALEGAMI